MFCCMFLFCLGLVDDIMLKEVDIVVKQTSKLEKISIKLGSSLKKANFYLSARGGC